MGIDDLTALSPLLVTAAAAVAALLVTSFRRSHGLVLAIALIGFALAGASIPTAAAMAPRQVTPLLILDGYALFYMGLLLATSAVVSVLAFKYLDQRRENREEFYILVLVATLGAMVLAASSHFASLFLGLEIMSVAIYVLVAYLRQGPRSIEAGIKYLILAGASSAFLILGMALIYAQSGTMQFAAMAERVAAAGAPGLALAGLALMVTGIGFKLALVPFHMWTPDVYQGAPAPVTAFVATVSKGGMFAVLLRYFAGLTGDVYGPIVLVFALIAFASMLAGNLLALLESNVKRMLAYSSIAHLGYLFVALLAGGSLANEAVTFYLVAYFVTTLAAFGVVTVLSDSEREAERLEDYRGLFWRRPWLASLLTAALLSLAGIPLTAGFLGKFYVAAAGVEAAQWALVICLVAGSAIGLFYYLRLVVVMFGTVAPDGERPSWPEVHRVWGGAAVVLAILMSALLWLGVYPSPLLGLIEASVTNLR